MTADKISGKSYYIGGEVEEEVREEEVASMTRWGAEEVVSVWFGC